jgi:hypothetical protein
MVFFITEFAADPGLAAPIAAKPLPAFTHELIPLLGGAQFEMQSYHGFGSHHGIVRGL